MKAKRILVVDDNTHLCLMLAEELCEVGFDTAVASNGADALKVLATANPLPDIILLDLMMPVMDGWIFMDELAKKPEWKRIPVIVMSGTSDLQYPTNAIAFIPKDTLSMDKLLSVMN